MNSKEFIFDEKLILNNHLYTMNNLINIITTVKDNVFIKRESVNQASQFICSISNQIFEVKNVFLSFNV